MKPDELRDLDPARILDLDVRADLRSGQEPFQRIMHARQALADDGVLRLRAIFEPRPLYQVLGREGFRHWTEQLADDDWRVWFYRDGAGSAKQAESARDELDVDGPAARTGPGCGCGPGEAPRRPSGCGNPGPAPDLHTLDVRGLEPPEPMVRTLEALAELPPGETLVQLNDRVPRFLLPELEARGFAWTVLDDDGSPVRTAVRHAGEGPVVDARLLPAARKHAAIFQALDELDRGEALVLLNDHDPVPLRYQLDAERPAAFSWEYLEEGPARWRVRIGRTD